MNKITKRILLSAFDCEPGQGSEKGNGWNWAIGLANKGYEVHCLTRSVNRPAIEQHVRIENLYFHYIPMPLRMEVLFLLTPSSIYLHYMIWQYLAYRKGKFLHKKMRFALVHHVSWGSTQMGSHLYKLDVPFIFGPAGGGQKAPEAFKSYFSEHWDAEIKREKVSDWLIRYNPACNKMLKNAHVVLSSNPDTFAMAKKAGATTCQFSLDAALPESFFPKEFKVKKTEPGKLKLLWVGRFMPRKGLLLTLDVMRELKSIPGITLTIVGHGEMEDTIIKQIDAHDLGGTVKMAGMVPYEKVRHFYETHDAFFFTSLRDSCPSQVLEAMSFGMPVITLDLHGQALLVNDQRGIRCKVSSPENAIQDLKNALIELCRHPAKVTQMSEEAMKFALQQTWPAKIEAIVEQYYPG